MQAFSIENTDALEIIDSRGNPTVKARVVLESGAWGEAAMPSGASTGIHEARELRDGEAGRYQGKGVSQAVENVRTALKDVLRGRDSRDQEEIDRVMMEADGTRNKDRLGANALLAVSLANARAAAAAQGKPLYAALNGGQGRVLPIPMMNILNGGAHAGNNVDIQEIMVMPRGASSFREGLQMGTEIYHALGGVLKRRGLATTVGDEGGFAPNLASDEDAIACVLEAIEKAGYSTSDVQIALDAAASEWYENGKYRLPKRGTEYDTEGMSDYWEQLCKTYPICSIEDPLGEQDWTGWSKLTSRLGACVQLVGDDLFVTNTEHLSRGISEHAANALLVKCNQIGTLSEALDAIGMAKSAGYRTILSHRSGETEDTTIADLAVAVGAGQIKTGAPCRTDRVAKYNRLLRIESELGSAARYGRM